MLNGISKTDFEDEKGSFHSIQSSRNNWYAYACQNKVAVWDFFCLYNTSWPAESNIHHFYEVDNIENTIWGSTTFIDHPGYGNMGCWVFKRGAKLYIPSTLNLGYIVGLAISGDTK